MTVMRLKGFIKWPSTLGSIGSQYQYIRHWNLIKTAPAAPYSTLPSKPVSEEPVNHQIQSSDTTNSGPTSTQPSPLSQPGQEPMKTHQFDTYKLVSSLQQSGFSHNQAIALMKCLRAVLINGPEFAKAHYLSRGDMENVLCSLGLI